MLRHSLTDVSAGQPWSHITPVPSTKGLWDLALEFGLLQKKKPWGKHKFMILKCFVQQHNTRRLYRQFTLKFIFCPRASPLRKFPHKWDTQLHHSYDLWSIYAKKLALGIRWKMNYITVCVTPASPPPPSYLLHYAIHTLLETDWSMSLKS